MNTLDIVARLEAANTALMAKGYRDQSVQIGCKVIGNYGPVFWAVVHTGGPKNWVEEWATHPDIETAMDAIDRTVNAIPTQRKQQFVKRIAVEKLSDVQEMNSG